MVSVTDNQRVRAFRQGFRDGTIIGPRRPEDADYDRGHAAGERALSAATDRLCGLLGLPVESAATVTDRPLTTEDYRNAPSGTGPLAAEWADKPHRLVYDLCRIIESGQDR